MPWDPVFRGPFLPAWDLAISSRAFLSSRKLVCDTCGLSKVKRTCLLLELVGLVIFVLVVLDLLLWFLVVDGVGTGWVGLANYLRIWTVQISPPCPEGMVAGILWSDLCVCLFEEVG